MRPLNPVAFESNPTKDLQQVNKVLRGNVSYGDGTTPDNMEGAFGKDAGGNYLITMPAVANTAITITHNLGYVPLFFRVLYKDRACDVYDSGVAWTTTTISVKCTVVSAKVRLFIHGRQ